MHKHAGKTINDLDNPLYNDLPMADGQQLADRQTEPQQENYHVIKLEGTHHGTVEVCLATSKKAAAQQMIVACTNIKL